MNCSCHFRQAGLAQEQPELTTEVALVRAGAWTTELQKGLFPPASFCGI